MKQAITLLLSLMGSLSLAQTSSPVVIAHRGASGYLPEHTLEAKAMAHAMQADFIEQDLVLSMDDVPVVLHDIHLDNVTDVALRFPDRHRDDGRFYAIDFTLAELKQLRVTERFSHKTGEVIYPGRFPKGHSEFRIPTLEEELQLIQGLNRSRGFLAGIYPEIKQPAWHRQQGHDISRIVLPILERYGYRQKTDPCWLQCFEIDEVERLRNELKWHGRLVLLTSTLLPESSQKGVLNLETDEGMQHVSTFVDGLGPKIELVVSGKSPKKRHISDFVARAHRYGLVVHPYTFRSDELPPSVHSAEDLLQTLFVDARVDGLFADFPDVAVQWLRGNFHAAQPKP